MKAEILTIGDELLIGQTIDTNSAWIGAELSLIGFDIIRKTSIHDSREDIINALHDALLRKTDVILITGGLGPTSDDITKPALCEFFNTKPVIDQEVLAMVTEMMRRRNFPMNENNRRQAEVPEICRVLTNAAGTAPGMWFEKDNSVFISMPGVPNEMKYIMNQHVIPELKMRFRSQVIIHRNIMTFGCPEARLAEILSGFEESLPGSVKIAYLPAEGVIKLRLTGTGTSRNEVAGIIEEQVKKLYNLIPSFIYGENEVTMAEAIGKILTEKKMTLSTAESCTGGNIAHMITGIPGSSRYFKGSVVAYDNDVKIRLLGVQADSILTEGAVSEAVVKQLAENARALFNTSFTVATSGIAGPDGGSPEKPVGTVWIAVASDTGTIAEKYVFGTDRNINIKRFSLTALNMLRKQIINE